MCSTCGCGQSDEEIKISLLNGDLKFVAVGSHAQTKHKFGISHPHAHTHDHSPHPSDEPIRQGIERKVISLEEDILGRNNLLAERNRGFFEARQIIALNLVSSPGSGKTSLLEKTLGRIKDDQPVFVIEGDQQTSFDAERIQATGVKVVQINTGQGCHLDADMVHKAILKLDPARHSYLFIENVGNLVCPAMFDLGEAKRVVIISVTEGTDKPMKYPYMFSSSHLCIINKTDLSPYVDFDILKAKEYALRVNPRLEFIEMSVRTEEGLDLWIKWLKGLRKPL
jgi:hydrogenase nickel incorporation protein HypB